MATKTGIELKKTDKGWEAPCGCLFHIFDGQPRREEPSELTGETLLMGKLEPHWHPCDVHRTPSTGYRAARGASPLNPGDPMPEKTIRDMRDGFKDGGTTT